MEFHWYHFATNDTGDEMNILPIQFKAGDEFRQDLIVDEDKIIPDWFEFQRLISAWHNERGITSSLTKIVTCPSYLRIIGMGERALPLILNQLEKEGNEPDFWFWALEAITGDNPVTPNDTGDMRAMSRAWLQWGGLL
jgi:hypothetical protein